MRLIEGKTYPGEILVDGSGIGAEKEATGSADGALMFFLIYKEKFFEALSNGGVVTAAMSRERISFSLKGSARAIEWLRTCTVNGATAQMFDRALSEATLAEAGDITTRIMAAILDGAGLTEYVLDPPNRVGGEEIKHEWKWGRVGGMQFYGPKTGGNFTETLADLIGGFRTECPGSPAPSVEIDKFRNGLVYGRAGFYCDNGLHKARYAIIAVDASNRVIFFVHVGLAEVAADISVADEGVFAVLGGIFE